MSTIQKIIGGIAVIALILSALAFLKGGSAPISPTSLGSIGGSAGAGTVSPLASYVYPNPSNFDYLRAAVGEFDSMIGLGGYSNTTGIIETASVGSCATTATSTIFAVANPFAATSTATVSIFGTVQASSTQLLVGTTTRATGITAATISATLISVGSIASSSIFNIWSGVTVGDLGYVSPGGSTFRSIVVGPNTFVSGFATTTQPGFTVGIPTCTYKIRWSL